jgi:hypothetical protein
MQINRLFDSTAINIGNEDLNRAQKLCRSNSHVDMHPELHGQSNLAEYLNRT